MHGRGLGGLALARVGDVAGGEQIGQHLRLQPIGAHLAPHGANSRGGGLMLVHVARGPGGEPHRLVPAELGRLLVGQEEECPAAQAVADAVERGAGLAGSGGGARGAGAVQARGFGLGG